MYHKIVLGSGDWNVGTFGGRGFIIHPSTIICSCSVFSIVILISLGPSQWLGFNFLFNMFSSNYPT